MNILRLCRLADVLDALPSEQTFNLCTFAGFMATNPARPNPAPLNNRTHLASDHHICGTSACACGYGALDPVLQSEGYSLVAVNNWGMHTKPVPDVKALNALINDETAHAFDVSFNGSYGMRATCEFFNLTLDQFEHLFIGRFYPDGNATTAAQVSTRLRAFILTGSVA